MISTPPTIYSWLNKTFENRKNGVFIDSQDLESFEAIQNFLEAQEHPEKTPAIYYQAFADEDLNELLATLEEELRLKLGFRQSQSCASISEVITLAGLKTVVIDRSHLYTAEMIDGLCQWLEKNQINLILVASQAEMYGSEILKHPLISQWERFIACVEIPTALASQYSNLVV